MMWRTRSGRSTCPTPVSYTHLMGRHPVLHAGAAENHGVAALEETAALREFYEIRGDFDRAQLVKRPSVLSLSLIHIFTKNIGTNLLPIL